MYTNKQNVLELVSLMQEHNIQNVVLCPGSRDIPIVRTLLKTPFFRCVSVTDERSASFIALGLCIKEKRPCAVVTTSGSALLNTAPAISEAFYQKLPLLVISADRARSWIDQMDGQTIEQNCIFTKFVKYETTLPEILDADTKWHCNRLCNEALLKLFSNDLGPVHINVPISDPFFKEDVETLPKCRVIKKGSFKDVFYEISTHKRVLLIIGQQLHTLKFTDENVELLKRNIVISHEHLSNVECNNFVKNFDTLLLSYEDKESLKPDLVITLGGHFVSKQTRILLRNKNIKHINIVNEDKISDLFCSLALHVNGNSIDFIKALINYLKDHESEEKRDYTDFVYSLNKKIQEPSLDSFNQISATGLLLKNIKSFDKLCLANSSTVRYASLFALNSRPYVSVNRGVNGIEGSMSTFIGTSIDFNKLKNIKIDSIHQKFNVLKNKIEDMINFDKVGEYEEHQDALDFLIIGDLSFFYDMSALFNNLYGNNIRIMLINNEGGEIFSNIKGLSMDERDKEFIVAPHKFKAQGWALSCNLDYLSANDKNSFDEALERFLDRDNDKGIIFEVFCSKDKDIEFFKSYIKTTKDILCQDNGNA